MNKRILTSILSFAVSLLFLTACSSDEDKDSQPYSELLSVEKEVAFAATETSYNIAVKADCHWEVSAIEQQGWQDLSVSPRFGDGNGIIVVTSEQNHSSSDRIAKLTVSTKNGLKQDILVHQTKSGADLSISQDKFEFSDAEGVQTLTVNCNTNWEILGSTGVDWLVLEQMSGSEGIIEIPIKVKELFDDTDRSVLLTVSAGRLGDNKMDVSITQKGKPFISLTVSPNEIPVFSSSGESQTIHIACNGAWNAAIPTSEQNWLHAEPLSGTGNGEILITCDAYDGTTDRMSILVISSGSKNPQQQNVRIQQSAK